MPYVISAGPICGLLCISIMNYILDDRKNLILKNGIGIKSEKYVNKLEIKKVWKQVKDGAQ